MPVGRIARIWRSSGSRASVNGWISQYTDCSRIRLAMSWVYCEPKSRTRISWCAMSLHAVVGSFLGDDHVVNVALAQPRRRDLDEPSLGVQLGDRGAAEVAHRRAQPADQLVQRLAQRPLVRDAALDALGHELLRRLDLALEVAVLRAVLHRADRAHAAVRLVRSALVQDDLARRLVGAGEQAADHHGVRARRQRLGDVARVLDAAVGDDRDARAARRRDRIADRSQLRYADAGDDPRGADRPRSDSDLDRVDAALDQRARRVAGRDVARDQLDLAEPLAGLAHRIEHAGGVAVRGVDADHVAADREQRLDP